MFKSFFLAGFEGSTGYNRHGEWFDQVAATGHDVTAHRDYRDLAALGVHAARDTARWPLIDRGGGRYDFASLDPLLDAANAAGAEVIWDLFHYGYPDDLDLFGPDFAPRFADYCHAVARRIAARTDGPLFFTPVNEPSYFAYAAGEAGLFAPHAAGRGWALKQALCAAAIRGVEALWDAAPGCRIVHVDPICRAVAAPDRPQDLEAVAQFNDSVVFQAFDILAGRLLPELGGSPRHLDVVGINYYWTNQWEWGAAPCAGGVVPPLAPEDPRRVPLTDLVRSVWRRYGQDVLISETAHVGDQRGPWLRQVAREAAELLNAGVPLRGVCLYPILGMPDWHARERWTPMGLWDPICHRTRPHDRLACPEMLAALQEAVRLAA